MPVCETELAEIIILGDNGKAFTCCKLPDLHIRRFFHSEKFQVFGVGKNIQERANGPEGDMFVEKEFHASGDE